MCQGLPGLPVALGHRRLSHTVGKVCSLGLPLALFQLGWFPVPTGLKGPLGLSRQAEPKGSVQATHVSDQHKVMQVPWELHASKSL